MSKREKEPRVLSPLSSRNEDPTSVESNRFILLIRALPAYMMDSQLLVVTHPILRELAILWTLLPIESWIVLTSFCVEHRRHFLR